MSNRPTPTRSSSAPGGRSRSNPGGRGGPVAANRRLWVGLGLVAVVVAALVIALASSNSSSSSSSTATTTPAVDATSVIKTLAGIPAASIEAVGVGTTQGLPAAATGAATTRDGKPEVLYIGAEYCPFCAAERWPMLIALSRFGSFNAVGLTHSASNDVYPNTQTFTFHGATYTSDFLAFTAVETATNQLVGNRYAPLDTMTPAQQSTYQQLSPGGGIPFVDLAGKYTIQGASYDPGLLQGKSAAQIAAAIAQPNSAIGQSVLGTANAMTAALCKLTNGQPANVCGSSAIVAISAKLP